MFELGCVEAFGFPEVELALGVEPELGAVAEEAGEAEGHGCAQGALFVDELVDRLAGDFDGRGEVGDREVVVGEEVLTDEFSGVRGASLSFPS